MKSFSVAEISELVSGEIVGNTDDIITSPEIADKAIRGQITLIASAKYTKLWATSDASAAFVYEKIKIEPGEGKAFIKVKNVDLAMAKLLEVMLPPNPVFEQEIHPTAVIHKTAKIGKSCKIGAHTYIGKNVVIADGVTIYNNVSILDDSQIGTKTELWSGVVVRERTEIGAFCILHANCTIGSDGFGYRPSEDGKILVKIPHIGNVVIGNGVEIGSSTTVDRGKFSSTIIGDGCKIDNLVQIGHNSVMGRCCIMAGNSGLAGSVTLGDGVIIGGSASVKDHTTIGAGAIIGAGSGVIADVPAGKTFLGYPACDSREKLKQWVALRKLARS